MSIIEMVNEIKNRQRDKTAAVYPTADTVSHSGIYKSIWEILDANIIGKAFASFYNKLLPWLVPTPEQK